MAARTGDPEGTADLSGHSYLITGATRGLGYFCAERLARAGATVLLTGRNPNRLAAARAALHRRSPQVAEDLVETLLLDTSNLGSIRAAAATARTRDRLDGVLLNAGIVHAPRKREITRDGHELVFATNVLGHFALAGELLPLLAVGRGRMVWVGSMATWLTPMDPVDPQLEHDYTAWRAYAQSKVVTTALGLEADRRLREAGVPVRSIVAHPGYAVSGRTPGIRGVNEPSRLTRFADNLQAAFAQSKEVAARSLVRALADPGIGGGEFWGPIGVFRGSPRRYRPARVTRSLDIADRLWHVCEEATGTPWPLHESASGG